MFKEILKIEYSFGEGSERRMITSSKLYNLTYPNLT